jgi:capsular polysaccharide biosynthesis protein
MPPEPKSDDGAAIKTASSAPPEARPDQTPDAGSDGLLGLEYKPVRWPLNTHTIVRYAIYGLAIVLFATAVGYLVASRGRTLYAGRSEVLYQLEQQQSSGDLKQDRRLSSQLVTLHSREVLQPVAASHGLTYETLAAKVRTSVVADSEVLRIDVEDGSPTRARALAGAITREYLDQFGSNGTTEARQHLEDEIEQIDENRRQLAERLAQPGLPPVEQTLVQGEISSLLTQRNEVQSQLDDVSVEEFRQPRIEQITKAYALGDPVAPRPWRGAVVGALAGLVVAGLAVVVLARHRSALFARIRSPHRRHR